MDVQKILQALTLTTVSALLLSGCESDSAPTAEDLGAIEVLNDEISGKTGTDAWDTDTLKESQAATVTGCDNPLLITVRGTSEPEKGNLLSPIAREIIAETAATHIELHYPAGTSFGDSVPEGMRKLIDTVNNQAETCDDQEILLAGYSQGAIVIGEALTAPENRFLGQNVGAIAAAAGEQIKGIVFYGDPRFLAADSFNVGDYSEKIDGAIPRLAGALDDYADRIQSYCVADDVVCQVAQELNETGHIAYFNNGMQQEGAEFLVSKLSTQGH